MNESGGREQPVAATGSGRADALAESLGRLEHDAPVGGAPPPTRRRLQLDDPLTTTAAEDRPESWGDQAQTDGQRLTEYRENTPPHHG